MGSRRKGNAFWTIYFFLCQDCRKSIREHAKANESVKFEDLTNLTEENKFILCKTAQFNCRQFVNHAKDYFGITSTVKEIVSGLKKGQTDWLEQTRLTLQVAAMRKCGISRQFIKQKANGWLQGLGWVLPDENMRNIAEENVLADDKLKSHVLEQHEAAAMTETIVSLQSVVNRAPSPSAMPAQFVVRHKTDDEIYSLLLQNDFRDSIRPYGRSFNSLNRLLVKVSIS